MPQLLTVLPMRAPGSWGLTTEGESFETDPRWSTESANGVFDLAGRLAARKGLLALTTSGGHSADPVTIHDYIIDDDSSEIIHSAGLKLYTGTTALTDITGTITTPTGDDWQFANFEGSVYGVQQDHVICKYTGTGSFADLPAGENPDPKGNCILSAWGRLWVAHEDRTTIYWSGTGVDDFEGAGAGTLDTLSLWPDGVDQIVALAEYQNQLVIFGTRSTILYSGAEDPSAATFAISDIVSHGVVEGGRDTVRNAGNDLIFLSRDGLRSLSRGIQFSTLPLTDLSSHVRTKLISHIDGATLMKSAYSPEEHAYFLRLSETAVTRYWYFDVSQRLQSGDFRATEWFGIGYTTIGVGHEGTVYLGTNGKVAQYTGYQDDGEPYELRSMSAWVDLGGGLGTIPKTAVVTVVAQGDANVTLRWAYEYSADIFTAQEASPGFDDPAEWNGSTSPITLHEWGTAEWGGLVASARQLKFPLAGEGDRIQVGFSVRIDGKAIAVQQIDVAYKRGRIAA